MDDEFDLSRTHRSDQQAEVDPVHAHHAPDPDLEVVPALDLDLLDDHRRVPAHDHDLPADQHHAPDHLVILDPDHDHHADQHHEVVVKRMDADHEVEANHLPNVLIALAVMITAHHLHQNKKLIKMMRKWMTERRMITIELNQGVDHDPLVRSDDERMQDEKGDFTSHTHHSLASQCYYYGPRVMF